MIVHVLFGAAFGFVLSRAGATQYDAIHRMFLFEDLHLAGVIVTAIVLSAIGYAIFRRRSPGSLPQKPMQRGLILGGVMFGVGWALTGTCPGTALAQIGEGTLAGLITLAGILIGARVHGAFASRPSRRTSRGWCPNQKAA
jgi:uncharacterized protein